MSNEINSQKSSGAPLVGAVLGAGAGWGTSALAKKLVTTPKYDSHEAIIKDTQDTLDIKKLTEDETKNIDNVKKAREEYTTEFEKFKAAQQSVVEDTEEIKNLKKELENLEAEVEAEKKSFIEKEKVNRTQTSQSNKQPTTERINKAIQNIEQQLKSVENTEKSINEYIKSAIDKKTDPKYAKNDLKDIIENNRLLKADSDKILESAMYVLQENANAFELASVYQAELDKLRSELNDSLKTFSDNPKFANDLSNCEKLLNNYKQELDKLDNDLKELEAQKARYEQARKDFEADELEKVRKARENPKVERITESHNGRSSVRTVTTTNVYTAKEYKPSEAEVKFNNEYASERARLVEAIETKRSSVEKMDNIVSTQAKIKGLEQKIKSSNETIERNNSLYETVKIEENKKIKGLRNTLEKLKDTNTNPKNVAEIVNESEIEALAEEKVKGRREKISKLTADITEKRNALPKAEAQAEDALRESFEKSDSFKNLVEKYKGDLDVVKNKSVTKSKSKLAMLIGGGAALGVLIGLALKPKNQA